MNLKKIQLVYATIGNEHSKIAEKCYSTKSVTKIE